MTIITVRRLFNNFG